MASSRHYILFGCGVQAQAILYDLLTYDEGCSVTICDQSAEKVSALKGRYPEHSWRVDGIHANLTDDGDLNRIFVHGASTHGSKPSVAISAVPYHLNKRLTLAAIRNGVSFCDLGGNNDIVAAQLAMNDAAKNAGVAIVPDCGIAPGAVSIFARHGMNVLGGNADYIRIRVGGLPQNVVNPLGYALAFNPEGLVNEYVELVEVLVDGKRALVAPLGDLETLAFPELGALEAAYTSGGSSTLASTYEGRVKELNYKTLRYPGHWNTIREWHERGFFTEHHHVAEQVCTGDGRTMNPPSRREVVEAVLAAALPEGREDLMAVRVDVGRYGGKHVRIEFVDRFDEKTGHTAMMRTTGYSIAIVAQLIAKGRRPRNGTLRQEELPAVIFVAEWQRRGLPYEETIFLGGV